MCQKRKSLVFKLIIHLTISDLIFAVDMMPSIFYYLVVDKTFQISE